ncbi:universal stress protein [Kitasatospora sp. NPDC050543]|uniref:universal stress protein n=1 Tax=Kitasatospora sp. NPDC050543 TaxID=3364054 RepID=UPI0037968AB4
MGGGRPQDRIVVGVDGSALSRAAIRWAARQAALTGSALEAVTVWHFPSLYGSTGMVPPVLDGFDLEADAAKILDESLAAALGPSPDLPVQRHIKAGQPARALVEAARGACALVLGSHGHGAPLDTVLGSVSHYCVHHARCTVVIVKAEPPPH